MNIEYKTGICIFALSIALALSTSALAQTTQFTYQGRLTDSTLPQPTNGTYEMRFQAFDAVAGGNQFPTTVTLPAVQVVNGIFTVQIDLGATTFRPANVYIEIAARTAGSQNPLTVLSPRQQVTSAPFAIQSLNAINASSANDSANLGNIAANLYLLKNGDGSALTNVNAASLGGVPANQYVQTGDPRMTDYRNPLPGSFNYIQNSPNIQPLSNFNISGTGTANSFTASGTVSGAVVNAGSQFNIGNSRLLSVSGTNNFFAGINSGTNNTSGGYNAFFGRSSGAANTTGSYNTFFGFQAGLNNMDGQTNTFIGNSAGSANISGFQNVFVGANAGGSNVSGNNNVFIGSFASQTSMTGDNNTVVGTDAVVSNAVEHATAIGSGAVGSASFTVNLGTSADTVIAPNLLKVMALGAAGSTSLCRNNLNQISTCTPGNLAGNANTETAAAIRSLQTQNSQLVEQLKQQQQVIDAFRKLICHTNRQAEVCKEVK